jgi:ferrous iron transport protein A
MQMNCSKGAGGQLDLQVYWPDTRIVVQLSGKSAKAAVRGAKRKRVSADSAVVRVPAAGHRLADLQEGDHGVIDRLDLPEDLARRLMELGFLPGNAITAARSAPGGDPRVFRVDGSEIALRRDTARRVFLRR